MRQRFSMSAISSTAAAGAETAGRDIGLDPRQRRLERPIGSQRREQPLFEHRPHPFHLLLAAPRGEFAATR